MRAGLSVLGWLVELRSLSFCFTGLPQYKCLICHAPSALANFRCIRRLFPDDLSTEAVRVPSRFLFRA